MKSGCKVNKNKSLKNMMDLIFEYVRSLDGDGLCNPDIGCGCHLEDYCPCDSSCLECVPAKWTNCNECDAKRPCNIQEEWGNDGCYKIIKDK